MIPRNGAANLQGHLFVDFLQTTPLSVAPYAFNYAGRGSVIAVNGGTGVPPVY